MANILILYGLALAATYCGAMWLVLAVVSFRTGRDVERETFHLGLCFILAVGFLGLILRGV
jgi:hypothetical protein